MSLTLPAFNAGSRIRASDLVLLTTALTTLTPIKAWKTTSENSGTSTTTMQNDDELFVAYAANTNYELDLVLMYSESVAQGVDLSVGYTFGANCRLDYDSSGPHASWSGAAGALEAEWACVRNQTTSPSSSIKYGTTTTGFSVQHHGSLRTGATPGTLQLQWAPGNSVSPAIVTVLSGSMLQLTAQP